jgi:hypothetical protein
MSRHLLLVFGNFGAVDSEGSRSQRDLWIRAMLALPGISAARSYSLASEQPTPVVLGKRPSSPYSSLVIYTIDANNPSKVFSELPAVTSEPSKVAANLAPPFRFAYWMYSPITDAITKTEAAGDSSHIHLVFTDPVSGREAEYNQWYSEEHMVHALLADGFVTAQRFKLLHDGAQQFCIPGADPSAFQYLTLYGLQTDDIRASEDDMYKYATGQKPGMPMSGAMAPKRISWVYTLDYVFLPA